VPGSDVMGGGWLHRIQHGHDLAALAQIGQEHGSEGVIQGLYHVYGRDFFTPAGIPILPSGSDHVHHFLTSDLGLGQVDAADLISINAAELIARIAMSIAIAALWNYESTYEERRELEDLVKRASSAEEEGDFMTSAALFQEALSIRPQEGALAFGLGMARYRMGNRLDAFLRFRDAASWLAREEPAIQLGGAMLSLRGVAAGMALASIDAPARAGQRSHAWICQLRE